MIATAVNTLIPCMGEVNITTFFFMCTYKLIQIITFKKVRKPIRFYYDCIKGIIPEIHFVKAS